MADFGYTDLIASTEVPYLGTVVDPESRAILPTALPKSDPNQLTNGEFVYWKQQHPDASTTALVFTDVAGVRTNYQGFAAMAESAGWDIVDEIPLNPTAPDYTAEINRMREANVQFLYAFAVETSGHVRLVRGMRQQNFDPPLKAGNLVHNSKITEYLGEANDGWEAHLDYLPFLDPAEAQRSKAVSDFREWTNRLFPGDMLDMFVEDGWAAAGLFVQGLRAVGPNPTRATLMEALKTVPDFDSGGLEEIQAPEWDTLECFSIARQEKGVWRRAHPASGMECDIGEVVKWKK